MRSSSLLWTTLSPLVLLVLLTFSTTTTVSAQSTNCHACILKAIPTVEKCTALTDTQLATIDKIILGQTVVPSVETYKTQDPTGFNCLNAMMWDIVEYKGKLWGKCLDPTSSCPWAEMMQWLEMIPKIASIYGAPNPPAQVLKNGPA
ncbi:hypothetical protein BGX28_003252 [Mortierella sp. GBA30]|nr:hypothetical protein BGX28_003252 [Mortierella sp. GBA30]